MIERHVQDEARRDGPARLNGKAPARRGHCGPDDDGGVEKMGAKRRKRHSAAKPQPKELTRDYTDYTDSGSSLRAAAGKHFQQKQTKATKTGFPFVPFVPFCSKEIRFIRKSVVKSSRKCAILTDCSAARRAATGFGVARRSRRFTQIRKTPLNRSKQREQSFFPGFLRSLLSGNSSSAFICVICGYMAFFFRPPAGKGRESQKRDFCKTNPK